ncbi:MAG: Fe-S protein assembly co-chaperone HscB [Burkholderiaceae bacterium]
MNLQSDDFELLGLERRYALNPSELDQRWKDLQREVHPDRFASQGAAAQRVAMQWSVRINEAYRRLRDPLQRAAYLCELAGHPVRAEDNTAMPAVFLMQQMEWREALEDAVSLDALDALESTVLQERARLLASCAAALDTQHDPAAAVQSVRALMFVDRFLSELGRKRERFDA